MERKIPPPWLGNRGGGVSDTMYREPRKSSGNKGTFKPKCLRGHTRKNNLSKGGHCLTCYKIRRQQKNKEHRERLLVFKPLCKYGHIRKGNLTKNGHCRTCRKENKGNGKYGTVGCWKRNEIINKDGSPFLAKNYNAAFLQQNKRCAGCLRHQLNFKKALHADHDHKTGIFRGLLCFQCNFALGLVKDKIEVLRNLIKHVKRNA